MGEPSSDTPPSDRPPGERLDSWKEIATYVRRDVTTVQRWEKREGMPVHRHLHASRGSVYAFSAELDVWLQSRRLRLEEEAREGDTESPVLAEDEPPPKRVGHLRRWLVVGGVAAVVLVALAYLIVRIREADLTTPKITSLAVLPLRNLTGDPAQEYFADGMTEAVIGRLSMIRGLRVISRTSVAPFKETRMSAPEIARVLNVDALVEGSVIREGDRVRVHAQLIRGATDEHFWSETYDRDLSDTFALQSDVAQSIAQRVKVTITGEERARLVAVRPVAPEVYESYLKGQFALRSNRADLEKAITYFQGAIEKDATFAPAYVGLAKAYNGLGLVFVGGHPPAEMRPQAVHAARKALELDPSLADAHALLANAYREEWKWSEADAEYKQALDLNPNHAGAHLGFALWLLCQGRSEEAQSWARRARELDPVGVNGTNMGWILFQSRQYDEAIRELRSQLVVQPDDALTKWFLGFALIGSGQNHEAIAALEGARSLSEDSPAVMGVLVKAYAGAGRRKDALRLIEELKRRQRQGYVPAAAFVNAYLGAGDRDQAFAWCERAYQEKSNILQWIKVHPFFDTVRDDPRFADLLHRVGLDRSY